MSKEYIIPAKSRNYLCGELCKILKSENFKTGPHSTKDMKVLKSVWVSTLGSAISESDAKITYCDFFFSILGPSECIHSDWKAYSFPHAIKCTGKLRGEKIKGENKKTRVPGPAHPFQCKSKKGKNLRTVKQSQMKGPSVPETHFLRYPAESS